MSNRIFISTLLATSLFTTSLFAQETNTSGLSTKHLVRHQNIRKFYVAGGLDGAIFSTATIHHDGAYNPSTGTNNPNVNTMGITRFTYFVNGGFTFNFNFSPSVGLFTGVDIKNIGYIEQDNGFTTKRRTYNVGAPLGLKIGNMSDKGSYFFFGGGMDVAINFQEKYFKERNNKTRINEWLSDRTPRTMPYVFAGISFNNKVTVKGQYYVNNFLNVDYKDQNGVAIYSGTDVHLIMLSVGFNMNVHVGTKHKSKSGCHHHKCSGNGCCERHHNM